MTKKEIITEFCALATMVGDSVFNSDIPHDCFCSESNVVPDAGFQFSKKVLEFIETAIIEKIEREKTKKRSKK
jgi:hypothetical protein